MTAAALDPRGRASSLPTEQRHITQEVTETVNDDVPDNKDYPYQDRKYSGKEVLH